MPYPHQSLSLTGENDVAPPAPVGPARRYREPGGRTAAPGDLALLQTFLNTHYDLAGRRDADVFSTPAELRAWMCERGLLAGRTRITSADLDRVLAIRDGLRGLIAGRGRPRADSFLESLNAAGAGAYLELRFRSAGPELLPAGSTPLDRALGHLLAVVFGATIDGTWPRLKTCPGPLCGWVFFDHSRNNSGRWCSMNVCGGRVKSRAYYRRHRRGDAA